MGTSLASQLRRAPRIFRQERAADAASLGDGLEPALKEVVIGAASCSPYLMGLLEKEADWLKEAAEDPETAIRHEIAAGARLQQSELKAGLRRSKRRVALLTGLADLGGAWELEQVTQHLSDFADAAVSVALRRALEPLVRRGKVPGMGEADLDTACGMVVFAMGKMGAGELNYSSDIDLICLFDETRFEPDDFLEARTAFVKATRNMCTTLSEITGDGYVFRTDLRLRPDPAVTPVCMAMEAAERYYESLGRTWERAAYIKARPAAGDLEAGHDFLDTLRPFVWRRHLDFAAIQDAHDMRLAIREHKGKGGAITLPGHDMKLGRGGIREIEFFTQTRQLIAGGRDPDLRMRGTCDGLGILAQKGWVPEDTASRLTEHYRAHREVEHRLQMVRDAQTHSLPRTDEGFERLAAMMDVEPAALRAGLVDRLEEVHQLTESFFTGQRGGQETAPAGHSFDTSIIERWHSYPALRSPRGAEIFERLKPGLLHRLEGAARPDEALRAFDGFLAGLPAGVQLFSLLEVNRQLLDLLVDIVSTSPALASHLSRNAGVFDAVIGGDFFSDWPGPGELAHSLRDVLEAEQDYETRLDATRRWAREWHFRVGVHLLRGLIDAETASGQYADLADAVLETLWPVVTDQFALRYGPPPGRGAVIFGMGSLGARRLTPTSDLDILVIYDAQGQEASDGKRSLPKRQYFARLTQALITAMTAPMSQGKLYEVDMRLRPSGNQGPVATSLASFESYQKNEAWTWEHLALTRARAVAGPEALREEIEALCDGVLSEKRERAAILAETAKMRLRIAAAKTPAGPLDAKIGPGRLQDIELFAQSGALLAGRAAHRIADGLETAEACGLVNAEERAELAEVYGFFWSLQCAGRLLSSHPLKLDTLGQAGSQFLCRVLSVDGPERLEDEVLRQQERADRIITSVYRDVYEEIAEGGDEGRSE